MGLKFRQPEPYVTPAEVDLGVEGVGDGEQVFDLGRAGDDRLGAAPTADELPSAVAHSFEQRGLRKYGYPPDKQEHATQLVLAQAEVVCEGWA